MPGDTVGTGKGQEEDGKGPGRGPGLALHGDPSPWGSCPLWDDQASLSLPVGPPSHGMQEAWVGLEGALVAAGRWTRPSFPASFSCWVPWVLQAGGCGMFLRDVPSPAMAQAQGAAELLETIPSG